MIKIFYVKVVEQWSVTQFEHLITLLPKALHQDVLRYGKWEDRQLHLAGKLLLRQGLLQLGYSASLLEHLQYNEFGKPFLPKGPHFNISHSFEYAICVLSNTNLVGIDVEKIREVRLSDFELLLNEKDKKQLAASLQPQQEFFKIWAQKEAVSKALGKGLILPFKDIYLYKDKAIAESKLFFLDELNLEEGYKAFVAKQML